MNRQGFNRGSFSDTITKFDGYLSEEWIKQVLQNQTNGKVQQIDAFVGTVNYPGYLFPSAASNLPTVQFNQTTYVGFMEFVLPSDLADLAPDALPAYTVLKFNLDGVDRYFTAVSNGSIPASGVAFSDYVAALYPHANQAFPHNPNAVHVLRDIAISGGKFQVVAGAFSQVDAVGGSHTLDYDFSISVSGYKALVQ